jgi:hypothetical protein
VICVVRRVFAPIGETIDRNADSLDCALIICIISTQYIAALIVGDHFASKNRQLSHTEQSETICVSEHLDPASASHPISQE